MAMGRPMTTPKSLRLTNAAPSVADFQSLRVFGAFLVTALFLGCNQSSNGRVEVSGTVTLDDNFLDSGVITFYSPQEKLPSAGAAILAGKYVIPAVRGLLPGKYSVAIDSADPSGATARPDHQAMEIPVSRIPLRYNGETALLAEVAGARTNRFDFSLQSDHKPSSGQAN
jgi:hypothetical protein